MSDQEPASGIQPDAWPVPLDLPLYVSVDCADGLRQDLVGIQGRPVPHEQ